MVQSMKPGSVIVDMAAEQGGNCELTVPGEAVVRHGVTIIGYTDLASRLAKQSSTLYATNLLRLTEELCKAKDGVAVVNMEDDAIRGLTVVKDGAVTWPAPPLKLPAPAPKAAAPVAEKGPRPRRGRADVRQDAGHRFCRRRPAVLAIGAYAPGPSWGTSRCSCWPASSATWWCGTSRPRCTRR
jgi:NAD(P) transhydrogenase subunit alpha